MADARERVSDARIGGIMINWKGKFGFAEASQNIKHPAAEKNQGRIFISSNDLDPDVKLKKGCAVNFIVYHDSQGLGGEEVRLSKKQPNNNNNVAPQAKGAVLKAAAKGSAKKPGAAQQVKKVIQTIQKISGGKPTGKGPLQGSQNDKQLAIDRTNRQRVSKGRLTGIVFKLKGNIGWIKPDSKIPGNPKDVLFLHKADFEGAGQPLGQGCKVDFLVYQDEAGLGAEHCRHQPGVKQPSQQQMQQMSQQKFQTGKAQFPGKKSLTVIKTFTKQHLQQKQSGGKGQNKGQVSKSQVLKGKGKGGATAAPLKRKRVVNFRIAGEVLAWKGQFGWIAPVDGIDHPEASKNEGKIYVQAKDLTKGKDLQVGQTVEFFCYADGKGLGAEQVKAL